MLDLKCLEHMNDREERDFWACVLRILRYDDGEAAVSHLHHGRPIYYYDDDLSDELIREWPDGRKELVRVGKDAMAVVIGEIWTSSTRS